MRLPWAAVQIEMALRMVQVVGGTHQDPAKQMVKPSGRDDGCTNR